MLISESIKIKRRHREEVKEGKEEGDVQGPQKYNLGNDCFRLKVKKECTTETFFFFFFFREKSTQSAERWL